MQISHPTLMIAPTSYPVTLAQVKRQCEVADDDAQYDTQLDNLIAAAVDQFETDCDICLISRQYFVHASQWPQMICLPKRPLITVDAIKYYDDGGTLQTLATTVYSANLAARRIELKPDQVWPSSQERWDAIKVEFTCGHSSAATVPAAAKHAILLAVGFYFGQDRGDNARTGDMASYKRLVQQFLRSTYP